MKLAPGVEIIEMSFWGRPLKVGVFQGREAALVDTGLVDTPGKAIIPALESLGLSPQDLSLIICTHGHADHYGGNEELWRASGKKVRFATHRLDRAWIEDPRDQTFRTYGHYVDLGLMSDDDLEASAEAGGNGVKLDHVLEGGEVFDLGDGMELEIVFAPGHTFGNICVLNRKNKILVQGETITGVAQFDVDGKLLTTPFYEDPEIYLKTVALVAGLDFETLVSSHLPIKDRQETANLMADSVEFTGVKLVDVIVMAIEVE